MYNRESQTIIDESNDDNDDDDITVTTMTTMKITMLMISR